MTSWGRNTSGDKTSVLMNGVWWRVQASCCQETGADSRQSGKNVLLNWFFWGVYIKSKSLRDEQLWFMFRVFMRFWQKQKSAKAFLTDPLVVLLLLDLVHLLHQLSDSQLQLRQFVLGSDLSVVVGVFAHLDVQVNALQHITKITNRGYEHHGSEQKGINCWSSRLYVWASPHQHAAGKQRELGGVGVKADLMFSRCVRREGEASFWAVLSRQNHLQGKNKTSSTSSRSLSICTVTPESWKLQTALKTQFITLFSFSCIAVISQSKEAPPTCCSKLWQPIRTSWLKGRGANTCWFRVWAEGGTF